MNKDKILSYLFGFLLFSSGGNNTAYGMNKTTSNAGVERWHNTERGQLGVYHLMIVSKYFETIDDFINLEFATSKAKGNMEKFHFNPIALDSWSRKFFTSLETLHIYFENDDEFSDDERIKARVYWYPVDHRVPQDNAKKFKKLVMSKAFIEENLNINAQQIKKEDWPNCSDDVCLDDGSFKGFYNLRYIEIPDYVTELGAVCFENLSCLSEIVLPTRLVRIQHGCFRSCGSLKSIALPDFVSKIGRNCFAFCSLLTNIEFPKSLGILPVLGFYRCGFRGRLIVPDTILKIGPGCFQGCAKLQSIVLPTSITKLEGGAFSDCCDLVEVSLPSTLKDIQGKCFENCYSLTHIRLPQHMTDVHRGAFDQCCNLTVINQSPLSLKADELGCEKVNNLGGVRLKSLQTENLTAIQKAIPTLARLTSLTSLASIPGLAPLGSFGSLANLQHTAQLSELHERGFHEIRQTLPELASLSLLSTLSSIPGLGELSMLSDLSSLSSLKKK